MIQQKKLLFCLGMCACLIRGMEKPHVISLFQRNSVKAFVEAERKNDFNYFKKKSDNALINIVPLIYAILEDEKELEALSKLLKINKA